MINPECWPALFKANGNKSRPAKTKCKHLIFVYLRLIIITIVLALVSQPAQAAEVALSWDSCNGATGYKIYYGLESRNYSYVVDIGLWTQCTVSDLDPDRIYYFAVTAYNESGESDFSWEIAYTPNPCAVDFNVDGDIDGSDLADFIANPSATSLRDFASKFGRQNVGSCMGDYESDRDVDSADVASDL